MCRWLNVVGGACARALALFLFLRFPLWWLFRCETKFLHRNPNWINQLHNSIFKILLKLFSMRRRFFCAPAFLLSLFGALLFKQRFVTAVALKVMTHKTFDMLLLWGYSPAQFQRVINVIAGHNVGFSAFTANHYDSMMTHSNIQE